MMPRKVSGREDAGWRASCDGEAVRSLVAGGMSMPRVL